MLRRGTTNSVQSCAESGSNDYCSERADPRRRQVGIKIRNKPAELSHDTSTGRYTTSSDSLRCFFCYEVGGMGCGSAARDLCAFVLWRFTFPLRSLNRVRQLPDECVLWTDVSSGGECGRWIGRVRGPRLRMLIWILRARARQGSFSFVRLRHILDLHLDTLQGPWRRREPWCLSAWISRLHGHSYKRYRLNSNAIS